MKVIFSTVIRAAQQGDVHGGLYVVDLFNNKPLVHIPYEKAFVNDNERGGERGLRGIVVLDDRVIVADANGLLELDKETLQITNVLQDRNIFKSVHEICYYDKSIWVTSTGYDSIVRVGLDLQVLEFWEILGESKEDHKLFTGKQQIDPTEAREDDKYHINSISSFNGRLVFSGLITPLYDFHTMEIVSPMPTIAGVKSFQHNFYEYEDCTLINMTSLKHIGIIKDGKETYIPVPATNLAHFSVDKLAENNWNRGLTKHQNLAIIGSSPARLMVLDISTGQFIHHVQLEKDVRHAIHGLEILEA